MKKCVILILTFQLFLGASKGQECAPVGPQCPVGTGQLLPFSTVFFSPDNCIIHIDLWYKNSSSTNNNIQIAISQSLFEWDSTFFSFVSFTSYASGLNQSDYFDVTKSNGNPCNNNPGPDREVFGTRNEPAKGINNWRRINIIRSTKKCDDVLNIPCQASRPIAAIELRLRDCSFANWSQYHWDTNPTDSMFIAEFNNDTLGPSSTFRKIMIVINKDVRSFDASGKNCPIFDNCNDVNNTTACLSGAYIESQLIPLPVLLQSFNAVKQEENVLLTWTTEQELNNSGFEVQRLDQNGFKTIAFIDSKAPGGNSDQKISYSYLDRDQSPEKVIYYRLKQINKSGQWNYSEIKTVKNQSNAFKLLLFPNPGKGNLNIVLAQSNDTYSLRLIDLSGRLIKKMDAIRNDNIQLNKLKPGIYFLQVMDIDTGEKVTEKVVVQ